MLLRQITAITLFALTGTALAGKACMIAITTLAEQNSTAVPWTSVWVIVTMISLVMVLGLRLHRNMINTSQPDNLS